MPQNWKTYKLGDISTSITYGYTESASNEEIGPKFLRITDIQNSFISWEKVPYCPTSEKDFEKYKLEIGDIVIARTGNSTGATALIKDKINAVYASYLIRYQLDNKIADPTFISYILRSKSWQDYVDAIKGGSAQPGANAQQFAQFVVILPPLHEQTAIASILSALDDKIELNLQMNKTLEEMAMAIYKHWFVDFGPFKDGEFVESELGMIPKGWEVKSIYSIADYINGASFKIHEITDDIKNGYPIIKIVEIKQGITSQTKYSKKVKDSKYIINNEDVLFSWSGNPETSLGIFLWDKGEAYLNQHIFKVIPKISEHKNLILTILKATMKEFIKMASHKQTTGLGHVTVQNLKDTNIIYPDLSSAKLFLKTIDPIISKLFENQIEINKLTEMRDSLLPKLISGEITLKKLDEIN